jgi:hypothetical protein
MRKIISIQLHCLPQEMLELLDNAFPDRKLYFTFIVSQKNKSVAINELKHLYAEQIMQWDELLITLYPPQLEASSSYEFLKQNPNALVVAFGILQNQNLEESWVSTVCYDEDSYDVWKNVARKIKSKLLSGGEVLNHRSMVRGPSKGHYYSIQALLFSQAGGKLWLLGNQTNEFIPKMQEPANNQQKVKGEKYRENKE